jgi:SHAQKYF class myb-like DNA-binding protein
MSLEESNIFEDLFHIENSDYFFNFSTISDNLNDVLSELSQEHPKKNIKFILTKEESPSMTFLKKKICNKEENKNKNDGRWNKDEQFRFAEAVLRYGNDWKEIQNHVFSRDMTQVRSHAQKFLMKLKEMNFMIEQKIELNLSWTKTMNLLRSKFQYNELKELFFSVEQNDVKKVERNKLKNKIKKNKKKNYGEDSNCDTNGDSFHFFTDNEENINEEEIKNNEKEEKEEKEALEKFIECFNNTSEDIKLNSSFEDISY